MPVELKLDMVRAASRCTVPSRTGMRALARTNTRAIWKTAVVHVKGILPQGLRSSMEETTRY